MKEKPKQSLCQDICQPYPFIKTFSTELSIDLKTDTFQKHTTERWSQHNGHTTHKITGHP
jgi:hypothetical protein